ncbi:MAG: hypothetical protein R3F17_15390 [Planctomycetota bacterium]
MGLNGKLFTLMKFRSMRIDAEAKPGPVWSSGGRPAHHEGRQVHPQDAPRRAAPALQRAWRFDVPGGSAPRTPGLRRPARPAHPLLPAAAHRETRPDRLGPDQLPLRNTEEDALHKLQYDLFYIKNHFGKLFDVSILFSTIKTVILRKGT